LRVAYQGQRGADVGGTRQGEQVRDGVEASPGAGGRQHGRDRETDDVVAEDRGQRSRDEGDAREEGGGRQRKVGEPQGHPGVEAAQPELRRDDHEREQEEEGRQVHGRRGLFGTDGLDPDEDDRTEESDAGSVELEERQPPQDHPKVDHEEDDDDGGGQARL